MAKRGKRNKRNKAKGSQEVLKDYGKTPVVPSIIWPKEVLPRAVFALGNCTIWAGDVWARNNDWAAIISLGETRESRTAKFSARNGAETLLPTASRFAGKSSPIPEIYLNWCDYEAPPRGATAHFWIALLRDLSRVDGKVLVHCMGGHGRTGTAIAAMGHLAPAAGFNQVIPTGKCAVEWVRETYSLQAVESSEQGDYLESLGATLSKETQEELSWSDNWWRSYGRGTTGSGYDSAAKSYSTTTYGSATIGGGAAVHPDYCDMCGVRLGNMTFKTTLGLYCSDNCSEHDMIRHNEAQENRAASVHDLPADPRCDCANYGGGVSCAECDPDWQPGQLVTKRKAN